MKNDSATLNKLRNYLLDNLNYYQKLVVSGRVDLLCFVSTLHSALLLVGDVAFYDDVKKLWVLS